MKILITGNLGYIGAHLCQYLREKYPQAFIAGYDMGYFNHIVTSSNPIPERTINVQYFGDVRHFDENLLNDFDCVVHLAAISNDPMGNQFEDVTYHVNYLSSINLAKKAIDKGVKNFVFASSCSVYGSAGDDARTETSKLNPITAYAKSKVKTEEDLYKIDKGDTIFSCFRFATACGISDRLRLDLVLNDFVASALVSNKIEILSDGTPLRPLINIKDMARAIDWGITRSVQNGGQFLISNTGSNKWNYMIKDLAFAVQKQFPKSDVSINKNAPLDKRSYKVNFDLFTSLAEGYTPIYTLEKTVAELKIGLESIKFQDMNFRQSQFMRLIVLRNLSELGYLNNRLEWQHCSQNIT